MAQQKASYASLFSGSQPQSHPQPKSQQPAQSQNGIIRRVPTQETKPTIPIPLQEANQAHIPNTTFPEKSVYILTFLTDVPTNKTMTALRTQYFPPHHNRLDAHLTLFHAIPGSHLQSSIIPTLKTLSYSTSPFSISASTPFRLTHGIAIGVPKWKGGDEARAVHRRLKVEWMREGFLSEQDRGGFAAHWTVMNKEDDEEKVARAMEEVEGSWREANGVVEGLSLWEYVKGRWRHEVDFLFERN
jgi:hypothetical protein